MEVQIRAAVVEIVRSSQILGENTHTKKYKTYMRATLKHC